MPTAILLPTTWRARRASAGSHWVLALAVASGGDVLVGGEFGLYR